MSLRSINQLKNSIFGLMLAGTLCGAGCSPRFHPKGCAGDADCSQGFVCSEVSEQAICEPASEVLLRIGMSAPVSGPSQSLGTEMKNGVSLAFNQQNAAGGIRGRLLELVFRDDQYTPTAAETAARELLDAQIETGTEPRCPSKSSDASAVTDRGRTLVAAPAHRSAVPLVVTAAGASATIGGAVLIGLGIARIPNNCSFSSRECAAAPGSSEFSDAHSGVSLMNVGLAPQQQASSSSLRA